MGLLSKEYYRRITIQMLSLVYRLLLCSAALQGIELRAQLW